MYRRPKFLELLLEIRREMAHEADYDVDLFVESARQGDASANGKALGDLQAAADATDLDLELPTVSERRREIRKA